MTVEYEERTLRQNPAHIWYSRHPSTLNTPFFPVTISFSPFLPLCASPAPITDLFPLGLSPSLSQFEMMDAWVNIP